MVKSSVHKDDGGKERGLFGRFFGSKINKKKKQSFVKAMEDYEQKKIKKNTNDVRSNTQTKINTIHCIPTDFIPLHSFRKTSAKIAGNQLLVKENIDTWMSKPFYNIADYHHSKITQLATDIIFNKLNAILTDTSAICGGDTDTVKRLSALFCIPIYRCIIGLFTQILPSCEFCYVTLDKNNTIVLKAVLKYTEFDLADKLFSVMNYMIMHVKQFEDHIDTIDWDKDIYMKLDTISIEEYDPLCQLMRSLKDENTARAVDKAVKIYVLRNDIRWRNENDIYIRNALGVDHERILCPIQFNVVKYNNIDIDKAQCNKDIGIRDVGNESVLYNIGKDTQKKIWKQEVDNALIRLVKNRLQISLLFEAPIDAVTLHSDTVEDICKNLSSRGLCHKILRYEDANTDIDISTIYGKHAMRMTSGNFEYI